MQKMTITAKIQLCPNSNDKILLNDTLSAYRAACNAVSEYIFQSHDLNQSSVNHAVYRQLRNNYSLRSQMAQSVIKTVIARYKTILENQKKWIKPDFRKPQYDLVWNRDYSLNQDKFSVNTTYFAKLRKLPDNVLPISICGKAPAGYKGLQYKKLAPKYDFFMIWKQTHDNEYYIEHSNREVLGMLDVQLVLDDLQRLAANSVQDNTADDIAHNPNFHIALVCYEKPEDFCHRHLVAQWLREHGIACEEYPA